MSQNYINLEEFAKKHCQYLTTPPSERKRKDPHIHESYYHRKPICDDVLDAVGNTPLIRINNITKESGVQCEILAKCEFFNPMGSAKDRVGRRMVLDAEKKGLIKPNDGYTIIEPTSGNTGIGLAMAGIVRGYNVAFTLPDRMSQEKVDVMTGLGGKVIKTRSDVSFGHEESAASTCMKLVEKTPKSIFLNQYSNPSNPMSHYDQTAEEIIEQCRGKIDYFVCTAGTGGTLMGMARKLKERIPGIKIIAADPDGSVLAMPKSLNEKSPHPYKVEGNGKDFIPRTCEQSHAMVDKWIKVTDVQSFTMARRLIKEEGLLVGGSSGSSMTAALEIAKSLPSDKRVVVFFTDGIRNYMSKFLSDDWMLENHFMTQEEYDKINFGEGTEKEKAVLSGTVSDILPTLTSAECVFGYETENLRIKDIILLFNSKNIKCALAFNQENTLMGLFTERNITILLAQAKITMNSPARAGLSKEYRLLTLNDHLYYLSRALSRYEYIPVKENDEKYDICEHKDVLSYIMNHSGKEEIEKGDN